jgi:hypothetical protein
MYNQDRHPGDVPWTDGLERTGQLAMLVSVRTQNFKVITKVTEGRTLDVLPAIDFRVR